MSDLARILGEQHAHLLAGARELAALLEAGAIRTSGQEARSALSRLAGRLHVHLAMEDRSLYPALLAGADVAVREKASQLRREMGDLRAKVDEYLRSWPSARDLEARPEQFVAETRSLLSALEARIGREDRELYPLLADRGRRPA